jgi:hypothetical protein
MSKTKLDDRIENAMNAFFETEPEPNRFELTYSGHSETITSAEPTFSAKAERWTGIARELLMFGPGTFMLFYVTLSLVFFYPPMGISFQGLFLFLSAAFLTFAGSGSIAKFKNIAVPLSIVAMALAVVPFSLLLFGRQDADIYFWYSIYLFPVVMIAAKVVQGWVAD